MFVSTRADLVDLGINVGDFVALIASPELTDDGFVVSRHLDGKAGVAVALALAKNVMERNVVLPHRTTIMITITEEVGHGASHGRRPTSPSWCRWTTPCAHPGQQSIEHGVTIPMADLHGPFDYHLTRGLLPARHGPGHPARPGHLPLLPLRRGRGDRGGRQHPGRAGGLRARRQPRVGTDPPRLPGVGRICCCRAGCARR